MSQIQRHFFYQNVIPFFFFFLSFFFFFVVSLLDGALEQHHFIAHVMCLIIRCAQDHNKVGILQLDDG